MTRPPHKSRAVYVLKAIWKLLFDAANGWLDHRAASTGAALAFYTVFSLAPVLTLSIAIAGFFFGEAAARGEIVGQIHDLVGAQGAELVQSVLRNASRPGAGVIATIVSVITLILGANTALAELKAGLDQTWQVPPERRTGFWYSVRTRLLSVGLILSLGFLLLVSLVISAALTALERVSRGEMLLNTILTWVNFLFAFVLVAALFATIYKVLPSVKIAWRDVTVGSLVTAFLFTLGKFAIGVYIGNSGVASTYGAAGSVVLILIWVYYSAQILLYGAEFTHAFAYKYGSYSRKPTGALPTPS
ncbi:MAG: YihY/virulence factor BrkB family protein [Proteobacteria bacterium]|nr:YihY/virulence factor BrkB family protein [Pseudomonadota bacterium]